MKSNVVACVLRAEDDRCGRIVMALIAEACALGIKSVEQRDLVGDGEGPI